MPRGFLVIAPFCLWLSPVAAQSPPEIEPGAEPSPVALHARALELLLDGNPTGALPLLRQAHELAPQDELLAFDLSRIAREHGGDEADQRAVLGVEATAAATRLLQAYLLIEAGDNEGAIARVEAALAEAPDHAEALELLQLLRPGTAAEATAGIRVERKVASREVRAVVARARTSAVVDSNVTVLPEDAPSHLSGYRIQVDAAALANLSRGELNADAGVALVYGMHLDRRNRLAAYDLFAAVALATTEYTGKAWIADLDLTAREVFLDSFADHFMQDLSLQVSARWRLPSWELGVYGRGGYRDFVERNIEGSEFDRDGALISGGVAAKWQGGGGWSADARVGYQTEIADGENMREGGPEARLALRWRWHELTLRALVTWVMRDYSERAASLERTDQRVTPQLEGRWSFTDWLAMRASYALTRNLSQEAYDYTRHLGQLGVEATW